MSENDHGEEIEHGEAGSEQPTVENGRYLYCVVDPITVDEGGGRNGGDEGGRGDESGDSAEAFAADGVDGEPARLLSIGDVGAIVHDCERVYQVEDPKTVQRWLLAHQSVVDSAAERFGTPLPMRFGTVIEGGDRAVESWLREDRDRLGSLLGEFTDRWEYRAHLVWDDEVVASGVDDDRLAELDSEREAADEGRAFLVEKQYERRLSELRHARKEAVAAEIETRLDELAARLDRLGSPGQAAQDAAEGPVADERFALLVDADRSDDVADALDEIADVDGLTVRLTGPWPPYSFAPDLGDPE